MDRRLVMADQQDLPADVIVAEAAAWLVRLQRADRTPATDAAFREWMQQPAHARAFARATDAWEIIPGAARLGAPMSSSGVRAHSSRRPAWAAPVLLAASVMVVALGGLTAFLTRDPVYVTKVGQQQTVTLDDGSRLALNTDSKLTVQYSKGERRVRLDRGEAMFEVAKNPHRPFIVQVGDEQVRALGTTFTVRQDGGKIAVVLVEGRVEVTAGAPDQATRTPVAVLAPGERLTVRADAGAAVDRPRLEAVTAWRQGEVMFDDTSLLDAVSELNRYGGRQVRVADPSLAGLRASGVFQTHEPEEFAQSMAALYNLKVEHDGDMLVLRR